MNNSNKRNGKHDEIVSLDDNGAPTPLLGGGEHFTDYPKRVSMLANINTPMDEMVSMVIQKGLCRPII